MGYSEGTIWFNSLTLPDAIMIPELKTASIQNFEMTFPKISVRQLLGTYPENKIHQFVQGLVP